jgi:hypothetical protein
MEHDGRQAIRHKGFSYLPRFFSAEEAKDLIQSFELLKPIWEERHGGRDHARDGAGSRRITRPVYWLGAWQFASLGYYAEPLHRQGRCLRGEALLPTMQQILERLRPELASHDCAQISDPMPNTCLINYYGSKVGEGPPVDQARLRMHRDGEPGPVIMFCTGQPGLLEFIDPNLSDEAELALWTRHRSVVIISGDDFKDRLYHRLVRVKHGAEPEMSSPLPGFSLRRVSVSFRHVPETLIADLDGLPEESQKRVRPYVEELARSSPHYADQLHRVQGVS